MTRLEWLIQEQLLPAIKKYMENNKSYISSAEEDTKDSDNSAPITVQYVFDRKLKRAKYNIASEFCDAIEKLLPKGPNAVTTMASLTTKLTDIQRTAHEFNLRLAKARGNTARGELDGLLDLFETIMSELLNPEVTQVIAYALEFEQEHKGIQKSTAIPIDSNKELVIHLVSHLCKIIIDQAKDHTASYTVDASSLYEATASSMNKTIMDAVTLIHEAVHLGVSSPEPLVWQSRIHAQSLLALKTSLELTPLHNYPSLSFMSSKPALLTELQSFVNESYLEASKRIENTEVPKARKPLSS